MTFPHVGDQDKYIGEISESTDIFCQLANISGIQRIVTTTNSPPKNNCPLLSTCTLCSVLSLVLYLSYLKWWFLGEDHCNNYGITHTCTFANSMSSLPHSTPCEESLFSCSLTLGYFCDFLWRSNYGGIDLLQLASQGLDRPHFLLSHRLRTQG